MHTTIKMLREGQTIDFEGVSLVMEEGELCVGDTYIAERSTGPHLLTVKKLVMMDPQYRDNVIDFVVSVENAYFFNAHECVKVRMLE